MPAIAAQILVIAVAALDEPDKMTREQAYRRMLDDIPHRIRPQKRMAAMTGVFTQSVPGRHVMHAMPEQVA